MTKIRTRAFSLALALLLTLPLFSSCANDAEETPAEETTVPTAAEETVEEVPAEEEISATDQIRETFAGTDLGGETFQILALDNSSHWIYSGHFNEMYAEELNGEIVNDSLFQRNDVLKELLNIDLAFNMQGNAGNVESIIAQNVTAGDASDDIALGILTGHATNMSKGNLLNVRSLSALDLSNYWWDQNEVGAFTYDNRLYWLCGDVNIGDDYAVQVAFFNKTLQNTYNLESPYTAILENRWTLETFYQMCTAVNNDSNGDGELTLDDMWGHVEANNHMMHWLFSMGEGLMSVDEAGEFHPRITDESHVNVVDTLFSYFIDRKMSYLGNVNNDVTSFTTSHCLFYSNQLYILELLREMEDEFGIIPLPKFTEDQENYGAFISHGGATAIAVPAVNDKPEDTGVVLEAMCGLSTDTLRSAFYDVLFSSKLVRDQESVESLDIIFANKSFDWGVDFSWAGLFNSLYQTMITTGTNTFTSTVEKNLNAIEKQYEKLSAAIRELP